VSKKAKHVSLEPTTEQSLRLELQRYKCELNLEQQAHMDALRLLFEGQINLFRLALHVAETNKPYIEQELARLKEEGEQLIHNLLNAGELVKQENCWPDDTKWDPVRLTFTAPADSALAPATTEGSKAKIRIQ
jgi:hypothetical protein